MNGFADALIGAAAANVAAHEIIDIGVRRFGLLGEQGDRRHNLPGLAIAALRDVFRDPRLLDRMASIARHALDCGDFLSRHAGDGRLTRTRRLSIDVHGTSPAQTRTTPKFRSGLIERVAEHPEQRHIRADVDSLGLSVKGKGGSHTSSWGRGISYNKFVPRVKNGGFRRTAGTYALPVIGWEETLGS